MTPIGNTNYSLIPPAILQQLIDSNKKGEPLKCTSNVQRGTMIHHTFDYSELLEYYAWR